MKTLNRFLLWMSCVAVCSWMLTAAAADDASPLWLRYPAVSSDGSSIAFTYGGQIWRVASSGGEAVPLTSGDFYSTRPVWSPDGQSIAFASKRHGNLDVFIMPASGGEIRRLTHHSANDLPYAFTPDGGTIYFASSRLGTPETELVGTYHESDQLYTVPAAGGSTRLLLRPAALRRRPPGGTGRPPVDLPPAQARPGRTHPTHPLATGADRPHRHRYYGVLAPNAPLRPAVTALAPEAVGPVTESKPRVEAAVDDPVDTIRRSLARYLWAMRLAHLYKALPLSCPVGGAERRIIAFITEAVAGRAILEHLGEPATPPRLVSARGPPARYDDSRDASIWTAEERLPGDPLAQPEPEYAYAQRVTG